MTVILSEGWESGGLGAWSADATAGETVTVVTTDPHHDSYHLKCSCDGSSVDERANAYQGITAQAILYGRAYFKLKSNLPANGKRFLLIAYYAATGAAEVFRAGVNKDAGGNTRWFLAYRNAAAWEQLDYPATIELDKWYCVELYGKVHGTEGEAKLYVDGTEILSATGKDTDNYGNISRVHFGERGSDGQIAHDIYVDCIVLADAGPIGLEPLIESGLNFFTNTIDKTPSTTGSFVDINVSGDGVPAGATGVILDLHNTSSVNNRYVDVRKNGSVDNWSTCFLRPLEHRYAIVGVDGNRIFEAYISSTELKVWLVGYCDDTIVLFTNVVDYSIETTGQWIDTDLSPSVPSGATGVILRMINGSGTTYAGYARKNGSTDAPPYRNIASYSQVWILIGCDSNRFIEQNIENTVIDLKLVGYTKDPVVFFTNFKEQVETSINGWYDLDLTGDTEVVATGAIFHLGHYSADVVAELRKNGSSDSREGSAKVIAYRYTCAFVGLDAGQVCEYYVSDTGIHLDLIGYTKVVGMKDWGVDAGVGVELLGLERAWPETGQGVDSPLIQGQVMVYDYGAFKVRIGDMGSGSDIWLEKGPTVEEHGYSQEIVLIEVENPTDDLGLGEDSVPYVGPAGEAITIEASIPSLDLGGGIEILSELKTENFLGDSGSGSEEVSRWGEEFKSIYDSGAGIDSFEVLKEENIEVQDSGLGLETVTNLERNFLETGFGLESITELERVWLEEGLGDDVLKEFDRVFEPDSGIGSEKVLFERNILESGKGVDIFLVQGQTQVSEVGSGVDISIPIPQILITDLGQGLDFLPGFERIFEEIGSGLDVPVIKGQPNPQDQGQGSEVPILEIQVPVSDSGEVTEVPDVRGEIFVSEEGKGFEYAKGWTGTMISKLKLIERRSVLRVKERKSKLKLRKRKSKLEVIS